MIEKRTTFSKGNFEFVIHTYASGEKIILVCGNDSVAFYTDDLDDLLLGVTESINFIQQNRPDEQDGSDTTTQDSEE